MTEIIGSTLSGLILLIASIFINLIIKSKDKTIEELKYFKTSELYKKYVKTISLKEFSTNSILDMLFLRKGREIFLKEEVEYLNELKKILETLDSNMYNHLDYIRFPEEDFELVLINPFIIRTTRETYAKYYNGFIDELNKEKLMYSSKRMKSFFNNIFKIIQSRDTPISHYSPDTMGQSELYTLLKSKQIKDEETPSKILRFKNELYKLNKTKELGTLNYPFIIKLEDDYSIFLKSFEYHIYKENRNFQNNRKKYGKDIQKYIKKYEE